jgi:predicted acetyltransferase
VGEGYRRVCDELDGNGRQQQPGNPGHQLDAVVGQDPLDHRGEPHGQPDGDGHRDDGYGQGNSVGYAVNPLDEQHGGHDRPRTGQQRGAERDEGHVSPVELDVGRLTRFAGEQFQRDEQQEQAARALQGGQAYPQVVQDRPAEQREHDDHAEGHHGRLPGQLVAVVGRATPGQPEEDRHRARRVDDNEQGDENFPEELHDSGHDIGSGAQLRGCGRAPPRRPALVRFGLARPEQTRRSVGATQALAATLTLVIMGGAISGGQPRSELLRLRPLRLDDEAAFRAAHQAMAAEGFTFGFDLEPAIQWNAYLEALHAHRCGLNLAEGQVPATFLVADVAGVIVGRVSIRHELNDRLKQEGGNIGYAVLPPYRRRGYATGILRQSLVVARASGVDRVLLTCNDDNTGSIAVIERCGGRLDSVSRAENWAIPLRRYWID